MIGSSGITLGRWWYQICPPYSLLLWYAVHVHLHWGVWMWITPDIVKTTPFWGIFAFCGQSYWLTSMVLIGASVLTATLIVCPQVQKWPAVWQIAMGSPQQILLFLSMFSCLIAAWNGVYADGTVHQRMFIFSDQLATIIVAPLHAIALIGFHFARGIHHKR